ncbi:hypothetical protein BG004_003212 [Podila humilis]|nr:hypothetical protein BG004_003212 [Podila humilis]
MYEFSSFQKVDVPYQMPSTHTTFPSKLKVLIIGAGIGGLMMGALLQKGGVDFEIYERARVVKPLGSAMSMGANLAPLFKQLGLYEEFLTIGKPNIGMDLFNEQAELLFSMDFRDREVIGGAREYIVARSDFYSLLLNQVSSEKIHMGKKVVALQEHERGITIRCEDSTEYSGDILIGADGTYSTIREKLYESLKTQNRLPPSDDVTLPFSCTCLLGQTVSLDPNDFPGAGMEQEHSQFNFAIGVDNKYSWTTITTKKNTICWFVLEYLDQDASTSKGARSTGWGPGAAEAMCTEVRHLKVPCKEGGRMLTIGDLIDISPKDSISKVVLEEKVFDTWYGGRTVLLGDGND